MTEFRVASARRGIELGEKLSPGTPLAVTPQQPDRFANKVMPVFNAMKAAAD
jgi:hypothetical protein